MSPGLSHQPASNEAATRFVTASVREMNNRLTGIKLSAGIIAASSKNEEIEKYLYILAASAG